MRIASEAHGWAVGRSRAVSAALVAIVLLIALSGCGAGKSASTSSSSSAPGGAQSADVIAGSMSGATPGMAAGHPADGVSVNGPAYATTHPAPKPTHRVTLTDHVCVQFEPQWTRLRVGETVTWHSNLAKTVTIYVSPGVFSRNSYVIHPGHAVRTGPVREPGSWAFWTEPAACHEEPRGVLLAGPGVSVEQEFYASAPGVH